MTLDTRARQIMNAIESTDAAITFRSEAIDAMKLGLTETAVAACRDAADATLAAFPGLPCSRLELALYLTSQVRGLLTGEPAVLNLAPLDN